MNPLIADISTNCTMINIDIFLTHWTWKLWLLLAHELRKKKKKEKKKEKKVSNKKDGEKSVPCKYIYI
jgi:hypothetical protein